VRQTGTVLCRPRYTSAGAVADSVVMAAMVVVLNELLHDPAQFVLAGVDQQVHACLKRLGSAIFAVSRELYEHFGLNRVSATAMRPPGGVDLHAPEHCCDRALEPVRIRNVPNDNRRALLKNRPGAADPEHPGG